MIIIHYLDTGTVRNQVCLGFSGLLIGNYYFTFLLGITVAIHKRGDKGLLAGLWEFPNEDKKMDAEDIKEWMAEHHMEDAKTKAAGKGKHIFSHVEWHMEGVRISLKTPIQSENYVWVLKKELENTYALPSAFEIFRKIL